MNLVRLLLRSSRGVVILSVIAGLTGGAAGMALIAMIQDELRASRPPRTSPHGPSPGSVSWRPRRGLSARLAW